MGNWDDLPQEYFQELDTTRINGEGVLSADYSRLGMR